MALERQVATAAMEGSEETATEPFTTVSKLFAAENPLMKSILFRLTCVTALSGRRRDLCGAVFLHIRVVSAKNTLLRCVMFLSLFAGPTKAQSTIGGDGGSGGGVICNHCTINGGSLNGGGGGDGGRATASPVQGSPVSQNVSRFSNFKIIIRLVGGQESLSRRWQRVDDGWQEVFPDGRTDFYDIVENNVLNGCKGVVARSSADPNHQVFIVSRGCSGMPFYVRDGEGAWGVASKMYDIH